MDPISHASWPRAPPVPSNIPMILGVSTLITFLGVSIVILRLWVRQFVLKKFWIDDAIILLAMLHSLGVLACFVGQTFNGGGHHIGDIQIPDEMERLQHWQYAQVICAVTGISVVKISVGFSLLRFLTEKWFRRIVVCMIVFVILYTIASEAPLIFECRPMHYSWAIIRPEGACISRKAFKVVAALNGIINVITDFMFVILPIPVILKLQVNRRTKLSLIGVLSLGLLACAMGIARIVNGNPHAPGVDSSWELKFYIWNAAELNTALIATSLPPLRPLFAKFLESTSRHFKSAPDTRGSRYGRNSLVSNGRKSGYREQPDVPLDDLPGWTRRIENSAASTNFATDGSAAGDANSSRDSILRPPGKEGIWKETRIVVHGE